MKELLAEVTSQVKKIVIATSKPEVYTVPVSYTHLDVYKRQLTDTVYELFGKTSDLCVFRQRIFPGVWSTCDVCTVFRRNCDRYFGGTAAFAKLVKKLMNATIL